MENKGCPFGQKQVGLSRVVNENEAKWARRIQELRKLDLSVEDIAKRLNEEDKESRRAGRWTRTVAWRILKQLQL